MRQKTPVPKLTQAST